MHGTVFDFVMLRDHVEFPRSVEIVAAACGIDPSKTKATKVNGRRGGDIWTPTLPLPWDQPSEQQLLCDVLHEYCAADDQVICYVRRHEAKAGKRKLFVPLTYGELNGKHGWHDRAPNPPRPLYGLNRLSHGPPDAIVLLCEGEKAADAAQRLFPGMIAMTWMGGASADSTADLVPLLNRVVILWPDADQPGRHVMARIAQRLTQACIADTTGLADGYDAADLEHDGCDDPEAWLKARLPEPEPVGGGRKGDIPDRQPDPDVISLAALQHEEIEPLRWTVPEYLPEGLTVFAGRPKIGKSWLMLNVALAVARGMEALGQLVEQGDVLYCGLEDGKRRMKSRVEKILGAATQHWPENFSFRRRLAALDQGGLDVIEQWLIDHLRRRLVVIDTLGRVRGIKRPGEEPYQYDYRILAGLHELAIRYRVAIVVVHHVRKSDAEDVLDTISGTTGIAGACDLALVLGRTKHGIRLSGRGRDTEEIDKVVEFDPDTGLWAVTGEYDEAVPDSPTAATRRAIYDLLQGSPMPLTPIKIAERLGQQRNVVRVVLGRMLKAVPAQVERNPDGSYRLPARSRARE
jgi:hypothetical protein